MLLSAFFGTQKTPEQPKTETNPQYITEFYTLTPDSDTLTQVTQIILSYYYFCLITDTPPKLESQSNAINYWKAIKKVNRCAANKIVSRFKNTTIDETTLKQLNNSNKLAIREIKNTDKITLIKLLKSNTTDIFTNQNGNLKDTDGCTSGFVGGRKSIHTRRKKVKQNKRLRRRRTYRKNL